METCIHLTKPSVCLLLFLLFSFASMGQQQEQLSTYPEKASPISLRIGVRYGNIIRLQGRLLGTPDSLGNAFKHAFSPDFEIGWKASGKECWHQVANRPIRGIGLTTVKFMERDDLGKPWAIYGFFQSHLMKKGILGWEYKVGVGMSSGWKRFDPVTNPNNDVIGSKINGYIEVKTGLTFQLSKSFFLESGIGITHFSNGSTKLPQKGINIMACQLGLRYTPSENIAIAPQAEVAPFEPSKELTMYFAAATRQVNFTHGEPGKNAETYGLDYLMANLTLGYFIQRSRCFKWGGGIEFNYDGTTNARVEPDGAYFKKANVPLFEKLGLSAYAGVELIEGPFSLLFHMGYDVYRKEYTYAYAYPPFYQRLGFKYHLTDYLFTGISIRALQFHVAKYLEWNVGVRKRLGGH